MLELRKEKLNTPIIFSEIVAYLYWNRYMERIKQYFLLNIYFYFLIIYKKKLGDFKDLAWTFTNYKAIIFEIVSKKKKFY